MILSRRTALLSGSALFAWTHIPKFAQAAGGKDPRLVVIILRGALDGLSTVAPLGDPDYAGLHGAIALSPEGEHAALPLDSFFALNPAMPVFTDLYRAGQATVVHAVATPYRDRSHFDGQDVLESGLGRPGDARSGWLNRAIDALPAGERIGVRGGLAVGAATPLVLRGPAPVTGWAPQTLPNASDDLAARVLALYRHVDPALEQALTQGLDIDKIAMREMGSDPKMRGDLASIAGMQQAAVGAARLIAADDGPRVAALAFDGWDTHVNEGGATGRLAQLLGGLDAAFAAFRDGLGTQWSQTTILAITEFGRTARVNGNAGTDHGTGTIALLAGGAVKGGRVIADWPGLKPAELYQSRDLRPTTDLRAVVKGVLADQFGLSTDVLADIVFPESAGVQPMSGLTT
jgi:uncharacterized protein (DUF1501 family)